MAWAIEEKTGRPIYVGELSRNQSGGRCGCVCPACRLPLQAVNAGKRIGEYDVSKHFRHPNGAGRDQCLILAARYAALETLRTIGVLQLPGRRYKGQYQGLSGTVYEAWAETSAFPCRIERVDIIDVAEAVVLMDDGRKLRVLLAAQDRSAVGNGPDIPMAAIELIVNDPTLAALAPEELRDRLTLLSQHGQWCGHWSDESLGRQASEMAIAQAKDALDYVPEGLLPADLPPELRYETLLHHVAKGILANARHIVLPALTVHASRRDPIGRIQDRSYEIPGRAAEIFNVSEERRTGRIRPDVTVTVASSELAPSGKLLVEVTVSNRIMGERLARIREAGLPALEIDVSRLNGRVRLDQFKSMLLDGVEGKCWIFHPAAAGIQRRLTQELEHQAREAPTVRRPPYLPAQPPPEDGYAVRATPAKLPDIGEMLLEPKVSLARFYRLDLPERMARIGEEPGLQRRWRCALKSIVSSGIPEEVVLQASRQGGLIDRLLTIKHDFPIDPDSYSVWDAVRGLWNDTPEDQACALFHLAAFQAYSPSLTPSQQSNVYQWRQVVQGSLRV